MTKKKPSLKNSRKKTPLKPLRTPLLTPGGHTQWIGKPVAANPEGKKNSRGYSPEKFANVVMRQRERTEKSRVYFSAMDAFTKRIEQALSIARGVGIPDAVLGRKLIAMGTGSIGAGFTWDELFAGIILPEKVLKPKTQRKVQHTASGGPNPYSRGGKWYWHDETGYEYGPYAYKHHAKAKLNHYCKTQL